MPDAPPYLEIKDWRLHQHYGKRRPPWIKLYTRLLDDSAFMALPEPAQAQLVKLWVLAASMGHPLTNDPRLIAGKIGSPKRFYLPELIAADFVRPCYQDASKVLAKDEQNARPLSTENREQSTTQPSAPPWQPIREHRVAQRLVSEAGRVALAAMLARCGEKAGITGEIEACVEGMRGAHYKATWEQVDVAVCDYAGKYLDEKGWEPTLFRGCVRRAMRPPEPDVVPIRRGGVGQRSHDNALEALKDFPEGA